MKSLSIFRSFLHAWRGLMTAFVHERNFRVHCLIGCVAALFLVFFPLSSVERFMVLTVIFLVFVLELVNTAIERTVDLLKPRFDETVREVKDLMAGVVFITALFAFVVGLMVFGPFLLRLFLLSRV